MFGLPADNLRHKYYTKRVAAPHPFWNDEELVQVQESKLKNIISKSSYMYMCIILPYLS